MTRNAISGRISGSGLISFGDNQICQFEADWAEIFGLPTNTVLADPIWGIDADGNVCRGTNADDPGAITYKVLTIKETELYCGFRLWDTSTGREVYVQVRDGKFVISEAATPGQNVTTGTWHEKLSFPLAAAAGQNLDFDFTGQASKFLGVKADETGLEYVTNPGLSIPTCKAYRASPPDPVEEFSSGIAENVEFTNSDWDEWGGSPLWSAAYPHMIRVPVTGVYLITVYAHWEVSTDANPRSLIVRLADAPSDPPTWLSDPIIAYGDAVNSAGATTDFHHRYSVIEDLPADYYIGLQAMQQSGGTLDLEAASLSLTLLAVPESP